MSERRRQRRRRRSRSRDRNGRKATTDELTADAASERESEPQTDGEPVLETRLETRLETPLEKTVETSETRLEQPEDPEAFGRWLRCQRELRGVELQAIAESSKISRTYLRALEDGRFGLLPAEIFAKGFVDQYARFVGLDPEEAVNFYLVAKQHRDEEEDALLDVAEPPPESSGMRWVVAALLLAALFLGVVWVLSTLGTDAVDTDAESANDAAAKATDGEEPTDSLGDGGESPEAPSIPATGTPAAGVPVAATPALAPLRVVVDFTDSCWVSAREDGGDTLQKLFTQGESLILEAERFVELKVGNHRSAVVEVNGMPYDLAAAGRDESLVRDVRIDLQTAERLRQATREQGP